MRKSLAKLISDPRVADVWDESGMGDGYWINLKNGWADLKFDPCQPTHNLHEWTIKDLMARFRDVEPCKCKECHEN